MNLGILPKQITISENSAILFRRTFNWTGPILERKRMHAIFQKNGKKKGKKGENI